MLRKLFGRRAEDRPARRRGGPRRLEGPGDLGPGDLLTFKHRLALPPAVQGETFEVASIGTYQLEHGLEVQLALDGAAGERLYLGFEAGDPSELSLSRSVPRRDVLRIFDEEAFSALWAEDFAELEVVSPLPAYEGWLASRYSQVKKWVESYYYDRDCRGEDLSRYEGDDGVELRCHECEDDTGRFGLSVEVQGSGETDVSLDVHCPPDVIDAMWPGER